MTSIPTGNRTTTMRPCSCREGQARCETRRRRCSRGHSAVSQDGTHGRGWGQLVSGCWEGRRRPSPYGRNSVRLDRLPDMERTRRPRKCWPESSCHDPRGTHAISSKIVAVAVHACLGAVAWGCVRSGCGKKEGQTTTNGAELCMPRHTTRSGQQVGRRQSSRGGGARTTGTRGVRQRPGPGFHGSQLGWDGLGARGARKRSVML